MQRIKKMMTTTMMMMRIKNNDDDDFDGVFEQPSDAMLKKKAEAVANMKKVAETRGNNVADQLEEEEERRGDIQQMKDNATAVTNQSNLAMQKAQTSIS